MNSASFTLDTSFYLFPAIQTGLSSTLSKITPPLFNAAQDCLSAVAIDPVALAFKTSLLSYAYYLHRNMDDRTALPRQIFLGLAAINTVHSGVFSVSPAITTSSTIFKVAAAAVLIGCKSYMPGFN